MRDGEHIIEGVLKVSNGSDIRYKVSKGVPNFLETLDKTKAATQTLDAFGREWKDFSDWGWVDDPGDDREKALRFNSGLTRDSVRDFLRKTGHTTAGETTPVLGATAIDCGCGNGRFSREAAKYADRVVAVDASDAAEVAFENMRRRGIENVGVVRASVHNLPFEDDAFDYAFSIGVLQHTGNAARQIEEMTRIVPSGKRISINCYGTGGWWYETVDSLIRKQTTRLSQDKKLKFADRLASLDRRLIMGGRRARAFEKILRRLMLIRPTLVQMYDWYAPEIAEHYDPADLKAFLEDNELRVVAATYPVTDTDYDDRPRKKVAGSYCFLLEKV